MKRSSLMSEHDFNQDLQMLLLGSDTNAQRNLFIAHAIPRSTVTQLGLSMMKSKHIMWHRNPSKHHKSEKGNRLKQFFGQTHLSANMKNESSMQ